jgi:hypothetical protein
MRLAGVARCCEPETFIFLDMRRALGELKELR